MKLPGKFYVSGEASGPALVLAAPLSFWGGVDPATGAIIDRSQTVCGALLAGKVLVMPSGRGSSSSSSVVAEAIRNRLGPVAFLMQRPDPIITAGAIVARSLYGIICPVVTADISGLPNDTLVSITLDAEGNASIEISVPAA